MIVVGIDEAGRGCWAGPLVAAAVVLTTPIPSLTDSKKLSRKRREQLDTIIREQAASYGLGWVAPDVIDEIGLTAATARAMSEALGQISCTYDQVIIDGNYNYLPDNLMATWQVKADATVPAVSAASVLAKVARDSYMYKLAHELPGYGFAEHVGYGTALHREMLVRHGVTEHHRKSYKPIQNILGAYIDELSNR